MQILVDLARCQSYGQCVWAAPEVFRLRSDEVLEWRYSAPPEQAARVERAARACPLQAITVAPTVAES